MTGQISEYLKNERDFNMKSKAFSIAFKGLSSAENCLTLKNGRG